MNLSIFNSSDCEHKPCYKVIKIYTPRLMQGGGDIVNLQINIANSANPPQHYDYSVSAVYDSGSSLITTRYEPIIGELSSFFHSTFIFIMPPYYGIIIVIFIILGLILSVVAYRPFIRMIIRQKFVRTVRKDLLEARSILKNNSCPDVCTIPCTADWSNEKRKWLERKRNNHQNDHIPENETKRKHKKPNIINRYIRWDIFDKTESFFDVKDYTLVDDYYTKLEERKCKAHIGQPITNKYQQEPFTQKVLEDEVSNAILYHLAEQALNKIRWNKYLPERPLFTTKQKS